MLHLAEGNIESMVKLFMNIWSSEFLAKFLENVLVLVSFILKDTKTSIKNALSSVNGVNTFLKTYIQSSRGTFKKLRLCLKHVFSSEFCEKFQDNYF